jgi:hypothetical protein
LEISTTYSLNVVSDLFGNQFSNVLILRIADSDLITVLLDC